MGTTWVVIVNQSQVQVQPRQGKYYHGCVEKEQTPQRENQEIDHPPQREVDEDPARVMTVQASSVQLSTEEMQHFEEAQKIDEELQEVFSQSKEQWQRKKFRVSPQGIVYRVEGDQWLMVVPKVLQQKVIRENHDVLAIGHVGLNRIVNHIKRAFWWRGMWSTMGEYVRAYPVYQLVKSNNGKRREFCSQSHYRNGNGNKSLQT